MEPKDLPRCILVSCSVLSGIACFWAFLHLYWKPPSVRRRLFWAQLLALVLADLFTSAGLLTGYFVYYRSYLQATAFGSLLWSLLLEVQIGMAFAASCHTVVKSTRVFRIMIAVSFCYAVGVSVFFGYSCSRAMESRLCDAVLVGHMLPCILLTLTAYIVAFVGMWSAPRFARRHAMLRASTYAGNALIVFVPNAILHSLVILGHISLLPDARRLPANVDEFAGFVGQCLYTLNGAINVGTYCFWMCKEGKSEQRGSLGDLENLVLARYFDLTDSDHDAFMVRRSAAEAIAAAQETRATLEDYEGG